MKSVGVIFSSTPDTVYSYLCDDDLEVAVGDFIVVETKAKGYQVVKANSVSAPTGMEAVWVVDKVDISAYEERKVKAIRKHELEQLAHAEYHAVKQREAYEAAAEKSPVLKDILEELDSLK